MKKKSPKKKSKTLHIRLRFVITFCFIICIVLFLTQLPFLNPSKTVLGTSDTLQLHWLLPPFMRSGATPTPRPTSTAPTPTPSGPTPTTNPLHSPTPTTTFWFNTPTPPPPTPTRDPSACHYNDGLLADPTNPMNPSCNCPALMQLCWNGGAGPSYAQDPNYTHRPDPRVPPLFCQTRQNGYYCFDKPVIYLYPMQKTLVDVKVIMENGLVTVSDPLYDEVFQGWDDVTAYPDGTLFYKGKKYRELFYETATTQVKPPTKGMVVRKEQLLKELTRFTAHLGLIESEQNEFLAYWMPELKDLNAPYYFISLIDAAQKEQVDHVVISPKPDVFINFLVYFKPLSQPITVEPLVLPKTPVRTGFTAVEWGGTIDPN